MASSRSVDSECRILCSPTDHFITRPFMHRLLSIVLLLLISLTGISRAANNVVFEGSPGWKISNGKCTFNVPGKIVNRSPEGSISGTLRLCLWATSAPFPSRGYRVATYSLGQLKGGYQFSNINPQVSATVPNVTGSYYFTVALEQYDGSGYPASDVAPSSVKQLKNGAFVTEKKWKAPAGKVIKPSKKLRVGDEVRITLQGSKSGGSVIYVPDGTELKLRAKIKANGKTVVYGGSKPEGAPARYSYKIKKAKYRGKKSKVGQLKLDYGYNLGVKSTSTLTLFYQGKKKGFYKSVENEQGAKGVSWGVFKIR